MHPKAMSSFLLDIHADAGRADRKGLSNWSSNLLDYDQLYALQFETAQDFRRAIVGIFAKPDLKGAPFRSGGLNCIVVPQTAVALAQTACRSLGIRLKEERIQNVSELSPAEAAYIRKQAGFIYG